MTSPSVRAPIFQLDSFTATRFAGNPAAVVVLEQFLPDASLQAIAAENNLAETAFLVIDGAGHRLRWFTPTVESKALRSRHPRHRRRSHGTTRADSRGGRLPIVEWAADRSPFALPLRDGLPCSPIRSGYCARGSRRSSRGRTCRGSPQQLQLLAVFESAEVVRLVRPDM